MKNKDEKIHVKFKVNRKTYIKFKSLVVLDEKNMVDGLNEAINLYIIEKTK